MRTYEQHCGVARALDLVGERWAMLVVRELILGPKRFTDLCLGLPGIASNVLSARLRELQRNGVVRRRVLPPPAASTVYELTEYGRGLEGPLLALGRWGAASLGRREPGQTLRSGWLGVALKAFARPDGPRRFDGTAELRLPDAILRVRAEHGVVDVTEGAADEPDLVVATDNDSLVALLTGALPVEEAVGSGTVRVPRGVHLLPAFLERFRFGPSDDS